jgi:signal recognition particle receptor subunit alpha
MPVMNVMREHLMNKNVARDIADKICDSVSQSLVGRKTSGFGDGGVRAEVRRALEESLTRILTSKTSTDILLDITRKKQAQAAVAKKDPYAITFVGVNGVGKSTNLSKVAFWLLQNKLRVLIAACDTFRSGAVEQLRVHVRNLGKLRVLNEEEAGQGRIELYEKGYGKDAAGIAKDAIAYGRISLSYPAQHYANLGH